MAGRRGRESRRRRAGPHPGRPDRRRHVGAVLRLYFGGLGRSPEASTWSGRVAQLRDRSRSLDQIADSIAWSAELSGGEPLTTTEFVDLAYQRVYGRLPSSADRTWWVARIDKGASRGSLLVGLTSSNTFRWVSGRLACLCS